MRNSRRTNACQPITQGQEGRKSCRVGNPHGPVRAGHRPSQAHCRTQYMNSGHRLPHVQSRIPPRYAAALSAASLAVNLDRCAKSAARTHLKVHRKPESAGKRTCASPSSSRCSTTPFTPLVNMICSTPSPEAKRLSTRHISDSQRACRFVEWCPRINLLCIHNPLVRQIVSATSQSVRTPSTFADM